MEEDLEQGRFADPFAAHHDKVDAHLSNSFLQLPTGNRRQKAQSCRVRNNGMTRNAQTRGSSASEMHSIVGDHEQKETEIPRFPLFGQEGHARC